MANHAEQHLIDAMQRLRCRGCTRRVGFFVAGMLAGATVTALIVAGFVVAIAWDLL